MHKHTVGPNSFAKIEYELRLIAVGAAPPSIVDLVKTTHTRGDGSFIDDRCEEKIPRVFDFFSTNAWKRRMKIVENIATALAYLHTAFFTPFVYRNMDIESVSTLVLGF